jgi:hypothetical protein
LAVSTLALVLAVSTLALVLAVSTLALASDMLDVLEVIDALKHIILL